MDDLVSTVPMLESAITTLVWRWGLSSHQSLAALTEVADELGVDLGELAVLVLASELQLEAHRVAQPVRSPRVPGSRSHSVSLSVVGDRRVTSIGHHDAEADPTGTSWVMRDPQPSEVRSRRLGHVEEAASRERPRTSEPVVPCWPGAQFGLSEREAEVVGLLAQGLSNQEIAQRCYLSINSVKTYIRSAYRKMGVKSRTRAVLWAIDHGLRPPASEQTTVQEAEDRPHLPPHQPLRGLPSLRQTV